jgi:hypothetical protein
MAHISKEKLLKLIVAGIQASSTDHCQHWKFKLLEVGLELWTDKRFRCQRTLI